MKLSTLFFLAAAFAKGSDSSAEGTTIGRFELLPVGFGTPNVPSGKVLSLDPFSGLVFVEANPEKLSTNGTISVEVVGGVGKDGKVCAEGTVVTVNSTASNFTLETDSFAYPNYTTLYPTTAYPVTSNGAIGAAKFTFSNYLDLTGNQQLFFPNSAGPSGVGNVDFCVKVSYKLDTSGDGIDEYVTYFNARFNVTVSTDSISDFDGTTDDSGPPSSIAVSVTVDQESLKGVKVEQNITKIVDVDTYLCGTPGVNDGKPYHSTYKLGQTFQICVSPSAKHLSDYAIDRFELVVCENSSQRRVLVTSGIPSDVLTKVVANVTGSQGPGANQTAGSGAMAFNSVITPLLLSGNQTSFVCKGEVALRQLSNNSTSRLRKARFLYNSDTALPPRDLSVAKAPFEERELQAVEYSLFSTSIQTSPGVFEELSVAGAALVCHEWSSVALWMLAAVMFAV